MPQADIPYIIGVIREKEKELLEDDEYVRVIDAPTMKEAYHALADTPYGIHLAQHPDPSRALPGRLLTEYDWLKEMLGDSHPIITFISAPYDALHLASALLDLPQTTHFGSGEKRLGTMSDELLTTTLWHDTAFDSIPEEWREFLKESRSKSKRMKTEIIESVQAQLIHVMQNLATTPLTQKLTELYAKRIAEETSIRPDNLPEDLSKYELQHDKVVLDAVRPWRADPINSDAIIAWWYALAVEVKTLRLLLSAKASGFAPEHLRTLTRPVYLQTV
ncbi:MAG: V-type ATPase subunit [Candidatus Andersenbacteria bacterium]|nr:V-type ATPase subunit [Candidatus Andersenbacteria bacterium]MBI3250409.1 V-type ATPase subunit [Candidatus Andersenbacteria bacterium]